VHGRGGEEEDLRHFERNFRSPQINFCGNLVFNSWERIAHLLQLGDPNLEEATLSSFFDTPYRYKKAIYSTRFHLAESNKNRYNEYRL
jgi:hypothetical protein